MHMFKMTVTKKVDLKTNIIITIFNMLLYNGTLY